MTPPSSPAPLDLEHLRFADAVALGQHVRTLGTGATCQSEVAERIVGHLYDSFRTPATDGSAPQPALALVRCFQTQPLAALPPATQKIARASIAGGVVPPALRCLALLATRGGEPEWNRPETSIGHRVIPLPDVRMIEQAPMIAALLSQMGVEASSVVAATGSSLVHEGDRRSFNVFHVEEAAGSALIPAQQTFVLPHGIRSVVGLGGLLPSGELFAIILFARVPIAREVAELFRTLALSVKLAFLPFADDQVFPGRPA